MLKKSKSVLRYRYSFNHKDADLVLFGDEDVFTEEPKSVSIPRRDWLDMGQPHQITITIRPGDRLNV